MSELASIQAVVRQYLNEEIALSELKVWLLSRLGIIVDKAETSAGKLAIQAQHLAMLVDDGEISELDLRAALREEISPRERRR